jgi:hypothetical protein
VEIPNPDMESRMDILVIFIVLFSTLLAMVSSIWVAIALGNAISAGKKKKTPENPEIKSGNI